MKRRKQVKAKRKKPGLIRRIFAVDAGAVRAEARERKRALDWQTAGLERVRRSRTRQVKKRITLYLDADVLAFFKGRGRLYQRHINESLRWVMEEEQAGRKI